MKSNLISIVMSIYKEPLGWVQEAISSILNQTHKNIEFIIVLDNPGRVDVISLCLGLKDKRIIFLINEKNYGLIYSLNKAIDISTGDYIARMDADDISHINRLEEQLNYLERSGLDLIGCYINVVNENLKLIGTLEKVRTHKYIDKLLSFGVVSIVHPTFFGKNEIFKICKYNDLALYAEDMEFLCNAISKEFKIGNLNKVLFDCRYNENSITKQKSGIMEVTVKNIIKSFKYYKDNGFYNFKIYFNKEELLICDIKVHLLNSRIYFSDRKYFLAIFSIFRALCSNPESFSKTILNTFYKNVFFFIENSK